MWSAAAGSVNNVVESGHLMCQLYNYMRDRLSAALYSCVIYIDK